MVDWGNRINQYMSWTQVQTLLIQLELVMGGSRAAEKWADIGGIAFVHVQPDHYILYDAENGLFYDPGLAGGPVSETDQVPMAYYAINPSMVGT